MEIGNVRIKSYGNYSSDNYGAHAMQVRIGGFAVWFSYNTVVAFQAPGNAIRVRENSWGTTTGKHLNAIDGGEKAGRLSGEKFEKELEAALKKHNLVIWMTDDIDSEPSVKLYRFYYTFEVEDGIEPSDQLDQDIYDITSNNDSMSQYGRIEEVKEGSD
jgi:hypothetical protein